MILQPCPVFVLDHMVNKKIKFFTFWKVWVMFWLTMEIEEVTVICYLPRWVMPSLKLPCHIQIWWMHLLQFWIQIQHKDKKNVYYFNCHSTYNYYIFYLMRCLPVVFLIKWLDTINTMREFFGIQSSLCWLDDASLVI